MSENTIAKVCLKSVITMISSIVLCAIFNAMIYVQK